VQDPVGGGSMRRRALLAMFVALLVVGAYGAYVFSYPKYPEVKGCVNPFAVTKPVSRTPENWSKVHVFFKLTTTRDFWKMARPWDVDYSHVKVVKHTIEYNGDKVTMLAMGIPLNDKKHVIALYEFSKPVQGVKIRSYLLEIDTQKSKPMIKTLAMTTNGEYTATNDCTHECNSDSDCGEFASCEPYCCNHNLRCLAGCCGWCFIPCTLCLAGNGASCAECVLCALTWCPACDAICCDEEGSSCVDWGDMP